MTSLSIEFVFGKSAATLVRRLICSLRFSLIFEVRKCLPLMFRQAKERGSFRHAIFHPHAKLRSVLAVFLGEHSQAFFRKDQRVCIEDRAGFCGNGFTHIDFGHIGLCVLLQVALAALPRAGIKGSL